jgi:hypothetical protein
MLYMSREMRILNLEHSAPTPMREKNQASCKGQNRPKDLEMKDG